MHQIALLVIITITCLSKSEMNNVLWAGFLNAKMFSDSEIEMISHNEKPIQKNSKSRFLRVIFYRTVQRHLVNPCKLHYALQWLNFWNLIFRYDFHILTMLLQKQIKCLTCIQRFITIVLNHHRVKMNKINCSICSTQIMKIDYHKILLRQIEQFSENLGYACQ